MRRSQARTKIVSRLLAAGIFPNNRIDIGKKSFSIPTDNDPWCRVTFADGASETRGIGGEYTPIRRDKSATFTVQVFTRQDTGTVAGLDLGEDVANLYEGQSGDRPIRYSSPSVTEIGVDPQGWTQHATRVAYNFDVFK